MKLGPLSTLIAGLGFLAIHAQAQPPQGPPPPPQVTVATVTSSSVPVAYEFIGVTEASKTVEIRSRVQGFLETRDFVEGAFVEEGTRLFTIDARSFEADRQIAVARVEQAEARLRLAEQDVKRLRSVREPGAISGSDLDQKLAEQTNAAAALKLAKAELAKADLELSYTKIEAPLSGFIGKALKEIGSLVDNGQNSLLAVVDQVDPLYVNFKMTERDYLTWRRQLEEGTVVLAEGVKEPYLDITLLDGTLYGRQGVISFENVAVDVQTGSVELRGTFSNKERTLKPGQFVKTHLQGYVRPNSVTVPQRAVSQSPQGPFVYVVNADNKADIRTIKVGQWVGQDWVVEEGLQPGERIVVEGLTKVQPGILVTPTDAATPPVPPSSEPSNHAAAAKQD